MGTPAQGNSAKTLSYNCRLEEPKMVVLVPHLRHRVLNWTGITSSLVYPISLRSLIRRLGSPNIDPS